jgi:hypothetical protein
MAGVRACHLRPVPAGARTRRLACSQQKLYVPPTRYIPAVRVSTLCASARPRRTSGASALRKVALSRSIYAVWIVVPVPVAYSAAAIAAAVPHTTRCFTLTTCRRADCLTTWPSRKPGASTNRGRPRRPVRTGTRNARRKAVT